MKKSAKVHLAFLSSFAAAVLNGCGGDDGDWVEAKRCVNPDNVVVEDRWCEDQSSRGGAHGGGFYHYYYGGRGYYPGDVASGGGRIPQSGLSYASPSRIPRGGFGTTGRAFLSHGSSIGG
jgi:hypothetical protein